jgi:lipoyl(octanoyl) transferase
VTPPDAPLLVRSLGLRPYHATWRAMRDFTDARGPSTPDELWLLQHPPVYTLGQAGRAVHVREPGHIEVVATDRGGQVTYHGPGQLVAYLLLDLRRAGLGVRRLVTVLEDAVVALLRGHGVAGETRRDAPGVYVRGAKVAALGLRVRRGCCYHGLALNVDVDLEPFARIDPCGYPGLPVTRLRDLGIDLGVEEVGALLAALLASSLGLAPRVVDGEATADAYTG